MRVPFPRTKRRRAASLEGGDLSFYTISDLHSFLFFSLPILTLTGAGGCPYSTSDNLLLAIRLKSLPNGRSLQSKCLHVQLPKLLQAQYDGHVRGETLPQPVGKYGDFGRCVSDFFSRDFPSGQVKVEARTSSKSLFSGASFSDEFKVIAARDLSSGAITAEVKNTSIFPLIKSSGMGTDQAAFDM